MPFPWRTREDLEALLSASVPEGPSLDYKQSIDLESDEGKRKAVRDLTGMANGGGGAIVYGVAQHPSQPEHPGALIPLTDWAVPGRLEDILKTAIRPPFLYEVHQVAMDQGFVLVVEVMPSSLGPYMAEGYKDRRYFTRHGTRAEPMGEPEVRAAYERAASLRLARDDAWVKRSLPMIPPSSWPGPERGDFLSLSAVPVATSSYPTFLPLRPNLEAYRKVISTHDLHTLGLGLWVRGLLGESAAPREAIRIDRDGALGYLVGILSADEQPKMSLHSIHGWVERGLAFFADVWSVDSFRELVEIEFVVSGLQRVLLIQGHPKPELPYKTWGNDTPNPILRREVFPWRLADKEYRREIGSEFSILVGQAYGVDYRGDYRFPAEYERDEES